MIRRLQLTNTTYNLSRNSPRIYKFYIYLHILQDKMTHFKGDLILTLVLFINDESERFNIS